MSRARRKLRLLVLTSTFPRWAGDHEPPFVFELARRLTDRFDVTVLAPHAPGSKNEELISGIRVRRFRYGPAFLELLAYQGGIPANLRRRPWLLALVPLFLLAQGWAVWRVVHRVRPTAIHAHWLIPQGLIAALIRTVSTIQPRFVITAHGADIYGFNSSPARWLKKYAMRSADIVTVVSHAMAEETVGLSTDAKKILVAPMGVDLTNDFIPSPGHRTERTLVFAGRLVEKKGVDTLLHAMPAVIAQDPSCRLLIAGTGPMRRPLQTLAADLGISECVEFMGAFHNQDLPRLFNRCTLAVYPFRRAACGDQEGLGLVVIEAMGCELPVIVGDVPAVHDVIEHGVNGLITTPDNPQALSDAILKLLRDPDLAARLGQAGRRSAVAGFDWQAVAQNYLSILQGSQTDQSDS